MFKKNIKNIINLIVKFRLGKYLFDQIVDVNISKYETLIFNNYDFKFSVPNWICQYRFETFLVKEPKTLKWIDDFSDEEVLWDIGANVGVYSIYAARVRNCNVFSFEPSVFNLEFLARNIHLNNLSKKISIVPLALSSNFGFDEFKLSTTDWGGALSAFGESYDHNGKELRDVFKYRLFGVKLDDAANLMGIPMPDHIKVDVDGIEHLILSGGKDVLSKVKTVLIEINDDFVEQAKSSYSLLDEMGLQLVEKHELGVECLYNQLWVRKPNVRV